MQSQVEKGHGNLICTIHSNDTVHCLPQKITQNVNTSQVHNSIATNCLPMRNISKETFCDLLTIDNNKLDNIQSLHFNREFNGFPCLVNCSGYYTDVISNTKEKPSMYGKTFWLAFMLFFISVNIYYAIYVILCAMMFAVLGEHRNAYGRQRIWGSYGALLASVVLAFTMNRYDSNGNQDITYVPCFIGYGIGVIMTGVSALFFKLPKMPKNPTMAADFVKLFRQPRICLLFTVVVIMGCFNGGIEIYLLVFLRELNASSWVLGSCLFARSLGEIPALYFSGAVIDRIGHIRCLYLLFILLCFRYLGTSLIPNPWWELPLSFIRSMAHHTGYSAVCVYGSLITPPSMHATLQGVIQTFYTGLGMY